MVLSPVIVKRIFTEEESKEILEFLKEKTYIYHTPYKRYNKMVKVPRGQVSFTLNENIHYNYGKIADRMRLCVIDSKK